MPRAQGNTARRLIEQPRGLPGHRGLPEQPGNPMDQSDQRTGQNEKTDGLRTKSDHKAGTEPAPGR